MSVFGGVYDDRSKTFCRGFSTMDNLYISLDRSDKSKYFDVGEHMRL